MPAWFHHLDWAVSMRSDGLTLIFRAFSALGYGGFLMIFLPVGCWFVRKDTFARVGLWLVLSVLLNAYLKDFFQDPRPDAALQLDRHVGHSFGFPSGHAQMATVVWFWLAWEFRKKWIWIACSVLVAGICFSRLYLGVHDVEDILGGIGIGLASLLVFGWLTSARFDRWHRRNWLWQICGLAAVELVLFATWPGEVSLRMIGYGTFLIGFWAGVGLERGHRLLPEVWEVWRALASAAFGIAGLLLIRRGSGHLPGGEPVATLVPALITGLYMTAGAPWMFVRLGLAANRPEPAAHPSRNG